MDKVLDNIRILLVEDDEMNFIYLNQLFKSTGCILERAKTGYEALRLVKSQTAFDIVLMDIQLPDIDGKEVTRRIKAIMPNLPVIAQTASKNDADFDKIREAGCNEVLIKPLKLETVVGKIRSLTG